MIMLTNTINKYLISTRSYLSTGIFFILLTSSSIAYTQTQTLDIWFSLFCFTIIFQNLCLAYLINSYLDYCYGSEFVRKELENTLFKHITIEQLRGFIKIPLILNAILLGFTFRWKGLDAFLIISLLDLLQIIGVFIYTPSKYYALGHIVYCFVHYLNIWIFYYSNTKMLPWIITSSSSTISNTINTISTLLSPPSYDPFIYYSFYFIPVILQSIHANYHRDIESDKKAGIVTIAIILGKKFSLCYYFLLYLGGLVYLIFLMIRFNNIFFLLPFATISIMNDLYRGNINNQNLLNVQTTKNHFFSLFLFSVAILLGGKK